MKAAVIYKDLRVNMVTVVYLFCIIKQKYSSMKIITLRVVHCLLSLGNSVRRYYQNCCLLAGECECSRPANELVSTVYSCLVFVFTTPHHLR